MAKEVAKSMGVEEHIIHLEERHEVKHAYASHDKGKEVFGDLIKNVPLSEGLARMAEWCKATGSQSPSQFGAIEIEKKLYSFWKPAEQKEAA